MDQIYINNKLKTVFGRGRALHRYQAVKVGEAGVPTAEHQIPVSFMDDEQSPAVYTGGNWYSCTVLESIDPPKQ